MDVLVAEAVVTLLPFPFIEERVMGIEN